MTTRAYPITAGPTLMAAHGGRALTADQQQLLEVLTDRPPLDEWAVHMLLDLAYPELGWSFQRLQVTVAQLLRAGVLHRDADGLIARATT
jgi:hypothetical protein